ncbi:MAG: hypothetical protein QOF02_3659 [Blastocatellia bacterium]|nr:hypothetical protein [Blastocatellia bacterium]
MRLGSGAASRKYLNRKGAGNHHGRAQRSAEERRIVPCYYYHCRQITDSLNVTDVTNVTNVTPAVAEERRLQPFAGPSQSFTN